MNKIHSKSNINEIAEVFSGVIELSKTHTITEDTYFGLLFQKLVEGTNDLIGKINAGWLKSELKEKDDLRDLDVRAVFYQVEANCVRRPSANRDKAMQVKEVLDRYGMSVVGNSYTNQSAQCRAMLKDLNAPEMAKAVRAVSDLKQLLDNAEQSQADFDSSLAKTIEDKTERENAKSASLLSRELKDIFNDQLCGYLMAMAQANPDKYKTFAKLVSTLIDTNNKKVRDRLAALKRKKEEASAELN